MQNNIIFFQSTVMGGSPGQVGLFDLLINQLQDVKQLNLFEKQQVVVPTQALGAWLKDQVASRCKVCANVDFVVLLGPVLENFYRANNPGSVFFDFSQAKYIIYAYLCSTRLDCSDAAELSSYLYPQGSIDKYSAYQLAAQLQQIFHEYLYLRTNDLLNLETAKFKHWQKLIWRHLLEQIGAQKTFLDVYSYFSSLNLEQDGLVLPAQLFIFGLTSVYPSQLQIISKLADKVNVYWYYQSCSFEYYGDLLSDKAKSSLEKRLLKKPDLCLDDLYLTAGNPLVANLGQQSREFIELLHANDIEVYKFNTPAMDFAATNKSILGLLQDDIRQLKYRIRHEYRIEQDSTFYADPLELGCEYESEILDLPSSGSGKAGTSLRINICHNRMREVQVLFNEVAHLLNHNPATSLTDILITAPDIDDYAPYLEAVFANEQVLTVTGQHYKLPFNITGNRQLKNFKIIQTMQLMLNMPYQLAAKNFIELLMQSEIQQNLKISASDVELLKKWLYDNATIFGYSAADYAQFGYKNYSVHSFKHFLINIALGACLSMSVYAQNDGLAQFSAPQGSFIPYDNIDNSQIELANKIINLLSLLEQLRDFFYLDPDNYREITIGEAHSQLCKLQQDLVTDDESLLISSQFLGSLLALEPTLVINLPILNQIIDEFSGEFKGKFNFNGRISCASMQYMRSIPFAHIFALGMNFGAYPRSYRPNQLNLLANDWYLADRNYNSEDKQIFLDMLLAAGKSLCISYLGRKESDNSEIKPSPLLSLLINTLGQSFSNFWGETNLIQQKYVFKNVICQQSLHPFYNNFQCSYSQIWQQVAAASEQEFNDLRWNFNKTSPIALTNEQKQLYYQPSLKNVLTTFLYSNANLYRVLAISQFDNELELAENECLELSGRKLARLIYPWLAKFAATREADELREYLALKGILSYQHLGRLQFKHYYELYKIYSCHNGQQSARLSLLYPLHKSDGEIINLKIEDEVRLDDNVIIVMDSFEAISDRSLAGKLEDLPYGLKLRGLLIYLLVANQAKINDQLAPEFKVVLRQINSLGEQRDFRLSCAEPDKLLRKVLSYYVRSLTNPVLIHKAAISEYAKASRECYKNGASKYSPLQSLAKARSKYLADWQNRDLERLRQDRIFGFIADDYFEFIAGQHSLNDIVQIALILAELTG